MKRFIDIRVTAALVGAAVLSFTACQRGDQQALQSQVDSLTTTVERQEQDLAFYQDCISLFSEGMDSIAKADGNLMTIITNQEGTVTRESIKQELNTYANMLIRQRERIGALENQLTQANEQRSKLQTLLNHLNQQIAEKDATIQELQKKVEQKDFSLTMLQDEVTRLYAENEELSNKVQTQRKIINISQDKLHEAYYIIGTSKELKQAGVLSSKFLSKAKVDVDNIDVSIFKKVDIRKFKRLQIESDKITLKSEHPTNSYQIETDKETRTSTLVIEDEREFWRFTHFLIIQE